MKLGSPAKRWRLHQLTLLHSELTNLGYLNGYLFSSSFISHLQGWTQTFRAFSPPNFRQIHIEHKSDCSFLCCYFYDFPVFLLIWDARFLALFHSSLMRAPLLARGVLPLSHTVPAACLYLNILCTGGSHPIYCPLSPPVVLLVQ